MLQLVKIWPSIFYMHKGAHAELSECAPFFFIYAILHDRNTALYDRHTYVNLYIISIDSQSIELIHRYSNHKRYFYPSSWLKKGLAFINNKPINHGDNYKFNIYQIWTFQRLSVWAILLLKRLRHYRFICRQLKLTANKPVTRHVLLMTDSIDNR